MASLSHVPVNFAEDELEKNNGIKVAALPIHSTADIRFEAADLEACGTDSEIGLQEPSITKRQSLEIQEPLSALKRIWQNTLLFVLSITKLWRKTELDPYWKELPEKIKFEKVQDYTPGIPQLAAFINSDDSFCVWRTYGQLHSRVLLQKGLELNCLEKELQELDRQDDSTLETRYRLQIGQHCDGWDPTQKILVDRIAVKLSDYDNLLLKHHYLKSLPQPSKSNYESMLNFIWKERPLHDGHFDFVFRIQDFVRLGMRQQNDQLHDKLLRWISRWSASPLNRFFRDPKKQQDGTAQYYSSHRLDFVIKSFITILIILILMIPILLLYLVPMGKSIMAVIVVISLFVFAMSLSLFRDSKPQDMFFGTATYCAVILVFLAGQAGTS